MQPSDLDFSPPDESPPAHVKAEERIIGGILFDPSAFARVSNTLKPEMFYLSAHQRIYEACADIHEQGQKLDLLTVSTWLENRQLLDGVGGIVNLTNIADRCLNAINIDRYAFFVQERWMRRRLIEAAQAIAKLGYRTSEPLEAAMGEAEQALFNVTQQGISDRDGLVSIGSVLPELFNDIEDHCSGNSTPGLPCGYYDLDAMTQGFQRSDLIIAAGRPAMGKTSLVLNIALSVAITHRLPVVFYSLEMSKEQLIQRLLCGKSGVESDRIRSGRLNENEWMPLANAMAALDDAPLLICDNAEPSIAAMRSHLRQLRSQRGQLGMVVIDYLQLMDTPGDNRVQGLAKLTRSLKAMARELDTPVIVLSQLSRGVESRNNKRPMMSDLRESGAIEQDSDLVLMLYRDEYYNPDTPDRGIAEVIITKHRNGPTGTVKLLFEPQFTRFQNLAHPKP